MDYIRTNKIIQIKSQQSNGFWVFALIFFLLNPLLGIFFSIYYITISKGKNENEFFVLYILLSLYLGLIMSTKVPVSDWLNYKLFYDEASSSSFNEYMKQHITEPVFYLISFGLSKLFYGNFSLYAVAIISSGYYLVFISAHKFYRYLTDNYFIILFSILVFAFFNNHFSYSGHLTRQILAGSIFIYFAINKILFKKNNWLALIVAIFIHTSSVILFILIFIPKLNKKINLKNLFFIIIFIVVLLQTWGTTQLFLKNIVSDNDTFGYGFERLDNIKGLQNTWYSGTGFVTRIYYFTLLACLIKIYRNNNHKPEVYYLINLYFLFVVVLEYLHFSNNLFLHLRISAYTFIFIPFILPLLFFNKFKQGNGYFRYKKIQILLIFVSIFRFFFGLRYSDFQYAPTEALLIYPTLLYF